MANRSKQKGTSWETAVAEYLSSKGFSCERRALSGNMDKGDILIYSNPRFVVECKAEKSFDLSSYCSELAVEVENAGGNVGIVVVKAPRKNVSKSYVVMPLEMFVENYLGKSV